MTARSDQAYRRDGRGSVRWVLAAVVVVLVLAAVGAVYVAREPDQQEEPPPTEASTPRLIVPGVDLAEPPPPRPVLSVPSGAPRPRVSLLRRALEPLLADRSLGQAVAFEVRDLHEPSITWRYGRPTTVPASTLKLLTAAAALTALGPEHRFRTTVVAGATGGSVVLVGGGDPLLTDNAPKEASYPTPATLTELAAATASRLKQDRQSRVRVGYDTSLFVGPAVNPTWEPDYLVDDVVSPVTALWVDEGRDVAGLAARSDDPAAEAASRFAAALEDRGIRVVGAPSPVGAKAGAAELAAVESAPLIEIVQHTLETSDNEAAEVLLRQAALGAGRPGSFAGGVDTVRATLTDLGVDLRGVRIYDGSGLSRDNQLPVSTLVDVLSRAASPSHPELNTVLTTLPVAGFTGSLAYRFVDVAEQGLGAVRAKTGTLTGVHGLAGLAVRAKGRPMLFAVIADRVPVPRTLDARAQLDLIAATIAACACS